MAKKILYLLLVLTAIVAVVIFIVKVIPYAIMALVFFPWLLAALKDGGNVK